MNKQTSRQAVHDVLIILPAVALGAAAMISAGVSPVLWAQQIAAYAVFVLPAVWLRGAARKTPAAVCAAALMCMLAASLFGAEAGGARRWVDLGIFNVNAAMLTLPALIVLLQGMACPYPAALCAAAILAFQPDASQLTAFSAAAAAMLWKRRRSPRWSAVCLLALAACMLRCFSVPVYMEPVSYSEGVLSLLGQISPLTAIAGGFALAVIPGYWAYRFAVTKDVCALSLAVYYAAAMAFGLSGEYPVPFMGFGLSPVAGYGLAALVMPGSEEEQEK